MGDITQKIIAMQLNLHELRSYAGWTQEELGKMLGVSKESISQLDIYIGPDNWMNEVFELLKGE